MKHKVLKVINVITAVFYITAIYLSITRGKLDEVPEIIALFIVLGIIALMSGMVKKVALTIVSAFTDEA